MNRHKTAGTLCIGRSSIESYEEVTEESQVYPDNECSSAVNNISGW